MTTAPHVAHEFIRLSIPTEFLDCVKAQLAKVTSQAFTSAKADLSKLVYPTHMLPTDNNAKPAAHNAAISKLCSQVSRSALVCLGEQEAMAQREHADMVRKICASDVTRRVVEQSRTKIMGAKPAPVNDSATNTSLGRFGKALEGLGLEDPPMLAAI